MGLIIKGLLKTFWVSFLDAALALILGKAKEAFLNIIATLENQDLTGEQKKAEALKLIKNLALGIPNSMVNLAIEIAVNLVKRYKP